MQARFSRRMDPAAALGLAACNGSRNAYVAPPPPKVVVAQPLTQAVTLYLNLTGNTLPFNSVDLVARVQGFLTTSTMSTAPRSKRATAGSASSAISTRRSSIRPRRLSPQIRRRSTYNQAEYQRQAALGQATISLARRRSRNGNRKPTGAGGGEERPSSDRNSPDQSQLHDGERAFRRSRHATSRR